VISVNIENEKGELLEVKKRNIQINNIIREVK